MQRLDKFLVVKGYFPSREKAQTAIKEGQVFVDGKVRDCAFKLSGEEDISVQNPFSYVSRGAYKLLGGVNTFKLNLSDKTVLDIGASTGGFTEVCLEEGAKKVYSLDVGSDQLAEKLRLDARVVDLSKTDFRTSEKLSDVDFIVSDISFISLRHIIPKLVEEYNGVECVLLFKPQFECGAAVAKRYNGVVRDKKIHQKLLEDFAAYLTFFKIKISGLTHSPVAGKSGNIEYLFHLNGAKSCKVNINKVVEGAFSSL